MTVSRNNRADWDFDPVERHVMIPLDEGDISDESTFAGTAHVIPKRKAILREDTLQVFYIGTPRYLPVSHRTVYRAIIQHAEAAHLKHDILSIDHGAKVIGDFVDPRPVQMGSENIFGGLRVANSLDGSYRAVFEGFVWRERNNTRVLASSQLARFSRRHVVGRMTEADYADKARECLEVIYTELQRLANAAMRRVTQEQFERFVTFDLMPKRLKELAIEMWSNPNIVAVQQPNTLWSMLAILAYIQTVEMPQSLNEVAVYRLQQKIDARLAMFVNTA